MSARTIRALALGAVGVAMVASALVIGLEGEGQTFTADEWGYANRADNPLDEALLEAPARKYLLAVPMVFYRASFEIIGLDDYRPIRALGIMLLLVCAGLFFTLARRGVGDVAAVPPTVLLLFFGSAWDVVVTPLRLPALFAIAAGLGMLLCLERRDRRGDAGAAALLTASLASHPTGLAFAVAAAVMVLLRPRKPGGHTPVWVFLGPIALYALWWLAIKGDAGGRVELSNLDDVPSFIAESFTAVSAAITGAAVVGGSGVLGVQDAIDNPLTWLVAVAIAAAIATGLKLRPSPPGPTFWAAAAALVALWALTALAPRAVEVRPAGSGRYLYPAAVLLLLAFAELARGVRLPRAVPWVASAVIAAGFAYNLWQLTEIADSVRAGSERVRGYTAGLELVRGRVAPAFLSEPTPSYSLRAGDYYSYSERFGTPAYSPAELADAPPVARQEADRVVADALGIALVPSPERPAPAAAPPTVVAAIGVQPDVMGGCMSLSPTDSVFRADIALPPGGAWLGSTRLADATINLGTLAPGSLPLTAPAGARGGLIAIPGGSAQRWRLGIESQAPVIVCGVRSP